MFGVRNLEASFTNGCWLGLIPALFRSRHLARLLHYEGCFLVLVESSSASVLPWDLIGCESMQRSCFVERRYRSHGQVDELGEVGGQ